MPATRREARCELGPILLVGNPGCERVEFTDLSRRTCVLRQWPGSDSVSLQVGDNYAVLPRWQYIALIATLGRLTETGSMVDVEGCP